MVWDQTQPTNTTKIRNLGIVIRPNWQAIESPSESGASFSLQPDSWILTDRTPLAFADNPSAATDGPSTSRGNGYTLFCKQDAAGNQELFGIDPSSVLSQFTSTDRTLAQTGYALLAPGFLLQWGRGIMAGGTSTLTVTFPKAFSATAWTVTSTPYNNPITGSTPREWGVNAITDVDFVANAFNGLVPGGGVNFGWMAIGPV